MRSDEYAFYIELDPEEFEIFVAQMQRVIDALQAIAARVAGLVAPLVRLYRWLLDRVRRLRLLYVDLVFKVH